MILELCLVQTWTSLSISILASVLVFKDFSCRNSTVLSKAFVMYVCPLLEYITYIWSPNDVGSITKLECATVLY